MSSAAIVQKLWNSACLVLLGADEYCNVLPACRALLGAGVRDDLSACVHAKAGGMSYDDYSLTHIKENSEQRAYLLDV